MNGKENLQRGADEARKTARAAREFAGLLDDYAKYLTQPSLRQRADGIHVSALHKLNAINEGLAASHNWAEKGPESPVVQVQEETLEIEPPNKQNLAKEPKPRSFRVAKNTVTK